MSGRSSPLCRSARGVGHDSKAELFWVEFLDSQACRGPRGIKPHSTIPLEPLNGGIKGRSDVAETFPNEAAVMRLIGAELLDQSDGWAVRRARQLSLETVAPMGDDPIVKL